MKKFLISILMFGLVLAPSLKLNATGETKPELSLLTVNDETVNLSGCTEDADKNIVCEKEVPYGTTSVLVTASAKSGSKLHSALEGILGNEIELSTVQNGINIIVISEADENITTNYLLKIKNAPASAPKLKALTVKIGEEVQELDPKVFDPDTKVYSITIEYNVKSLTVIGTADEGIEVKGNRTLTNISEGLTTINIEAVRDGKSTPYELRITKKANPLKAELTEALKDTKYKDFHNPAFIDNKVNFEYHNELPDGTLIVKFYEVTFTEETDIAKLLKSMEDAATGASKEMAIYPSEGKITDKVIEEIKNDGTVAYIPADPDDDNETVIWTLDGSKISETDKGFDLRVLVDTAVEKEKKEKIEKLFNKEDKNLILDFVHSGSLPKGTKVTVRVNDKFDVNDTVALYYFNEKTNKLELINKNLKVNEFKQVTFELEHCSSYVILPITNNANTGAMNIVLYIVLAVLSLGGIVYLSKKKTN